MKQPDAAVSTEPVTDEANAPPTDLRLWLTQYFIDGEATVPLPDDEIRQGVGVLFASERSEYAETLASRDAEIARLREALRQLKRGRECAASKCQAPLGGKCTCGNARLVQIISAALEPVGTHPEESERAT